MNASLPVLPAIFTTTWPIKGTRWPQEPRESVGVYALVWSNKAYVGMTVSSAGFQGRWSRHHRVLFVLKRANKTSKSFRTLIKDNELTAQDFTLMILKAWPNPKDTLTKELTDEIALEERRMYDEVAALGYEMINNVRPRGTGYERVVRKKKRRRKNYKAKPKTS